MSLDCGDIVTHDALIRMVCCEHDGYVHLSGYPDKAVPIDQCHLVRAATPDERLGQLRILAGSSGKGHRPKCAKERLAIMAADTVAYDVGCC